MANISIIAGIVMTSLGVGLTVLGLRQEFARVHETYRECRNILKTPDKNIIVPAEARASFDAGVEFGISATMRQMYADKLKTSGGK